MKNLNYFKLKPLSLQAKTLIHLQTKTSRETQTLTISHKNIYQHENLDYFNLKPLSLSVKTLIHLQIKIH